MFETASDRPLTSEELTSFQRALGDVQRVYSEEGRGAVPAFGDAQYQEDLRDFADLHKSALRNYGPRSRRIALDTMRNTIANRIRARLGQQR